VKLTIPYPQPAGPVEVLANAKALLAEFGGKVCYRMGADFDGDPLGCDCSAFVARCCGQRKNAGGVWFNTDRIYDDAHGGPHVRWRQVERPEPGDIGVYPGRSSNGNRIAGHVWIVLDPGLANTIECCSSGKGIAKRRRDGWFAAGALGNGRPIIWARFVGARL
jgi:cell wall-associated NlpC family hydrolase